MNEAQRNNYSVWGFRDLGSLSMTTAGVKAEIQYGARGKSLAYFVACCAAKAREPLNSMKAQTMTPVIET